MTRNAAATSEGTWIVVPPDSDFSLANLPFGVVQPKHGPPRVATRIGDTVLDLLAAGIDHRLTDAATLNSLMASGRGPAIRRAARAIALGPPRPDLVYAVDDVDVLQPVAIGDYVDFYSSLDHATNLGRRFRPDGEPLLPNWRHLPVGYHGRAGTIVASGTPIVRPAGLIADLAGVPRLTPSTQLDFELEVGFLVGGNGTRIAPDRADAYVFGAVLCNDWSARDIQSFEYQPLGPNLGKSFATTISPWVVPIEALKPFLVAAPRQDPVPDPYLQTKRPWGIDLHLEASVNGVTATATNFARVYWTFAQQLAHMTVNGATARTGDFYASGTVSGPTPLERGSLIEQIADGNRADFLADGDTVTLRGWCGGDDARSRVGFGDATGTIYPGEQRGED